MKKLNLISFLIFFVLLSACNVFNSSDKGRPFEYQFKTGKTGYSLQDTVKASFKNKSNQSLYLSYQVCTIADMQKRENKTWKPISIPVYCTAEVKTPIQVAPGENFKTGIALQVFDKENFEAGTYRLNVLASLKNKKKQRELTSNNFEVTK